MVLCLKNFCTELYYYFYIISKILYFENFDLTNLVTPVKADVFKQLLESTGYPMDKTDEVITGFKEGFRLGYEGQRTNIRRKAPNLQLRVGDEIELWNKVMKEVQKGRYAGPFEKVPYKDFVQSLIGLVPKDGVKIPGSFSTFFILGQEIPLTPIPLKSIVL